MISKTERKARWGSGRRYKDVELLIVRAKIYHQTANFRFIPPSNAHFTTHSLPSVIIRTMFAPSVVSILAIAASVVSAVPTAALEERTVGGIKICTDVNWKGTCGYKVQPINKCIHLDPPWVCLLFSALDCWTLLLTLKQYHSISSMVLIRVRLVSFLRRPSLINIIMKTISLC